MVGIDQKLVFPIKLDLKCQRGSTTVVPINIVVGILIKSKLGHTDSVSLEHQFLNTVNGPKLIDENKPL